MGLCKCPKRKVTNQFCFEHRVNVCEYCLVSTHPKCIVKSYLHWLQDSDYNPVCLVCNENLSHGECTRLSCYDVFHWDCINQLALKLPQSTPPSGFTCPTCKSSIFPPEKLVSPVADALRKKLSVVGWGRRGLGLPPQVVVPPQQKQEQVRTPAKFEPPKKPVQFTPSPFQSAPVQESAPPKQIQELNSSTPLRDNDNSVYESPQPQPAAAMVSPQNTYVRDKFQYEGQASRKVFDTRQEEKIDLSFDHDDDKYKRRGVMNWLGRLFRLKKKVRYAADDPNLTFRRVAIFILLVVFGFLTVVFILTRVGRGFADTDPFLDPKANPNIRVQEVPNVSA